MASGFVAVSCKHEYITARAQFVEGREIHPDENFRESLANFRIPGGPRGNIWLRAQTRDYHTLEP